MIDNSESWSGLSIPNVSNRKLTYLHIALCYEARDHRNLVAQSCGGRGGVSF